MNRLRWLYLLIGIALLALVVRESNPGAVADQVLHFGLAGFAAIVVIYAGEFLADTIGWHATLTAVAPVPAWTRRLFLVRLVGEAFNTITPLAGLGGEPVKAMLLERRYRVGYADSVASLVLARTVNLLALVAFLVVGFGLILADSRFGPAFKTLSAAGLGAFCLAVGGLFLVQRHRVSSRVGARIGRSSAGARIAGVLHHLEDFDARLVGFYAGRRRRFFVAFAFGLLNWVIGAAGVWLTFRLLGNAIGFADAWILEAAAQLVRAGVFFIPAAIGAQEGALVVVTVALIGDPSAGLAAALVRRARELAWTAAGLAVGWAYSMRPARVSDAQPR